MSNVYRESEPPNWRPAKPGDTPGQLEPTASDTTSIAALVASIAAEQSSTVERQRTGHTGRAADRPRRTPGSYRPRRARGNATGNSPASESAILTALKHFRDNGFPDTIIGEQPPF